MIFRLLKLHDRPAPNKEAAQISCDKQVAVSIHSQQKYPAEPDP